MNDNKVIKASIWYIGSSFLLKGLGFITTPIFARILTPEEYGIVSNFYAWLSIISIVGTLSLSASLIRARFDFKDELNEYIKSNLTVGVIFACVLVSIFAFDATYWEQIFALDGIYIVLMGLTIMVTPAYDMFIQVQRFQYKYKLVALVSTLVALSSVVLSLLFIYLFDDNLTARILGGQLPVIVVGLCLLVHFCIKGKYFSIDYCKYAIPICVPYTIHLLSGTVLNTSDRIMITRLCGATDTALYSMAYNIALIVSVIWSSMNNSFSPWLGEMLQKGKYLEIKRVSYLYVISFLYAVVGLMLISPETLWLLGGGAYTESKYIIPPVMAGYVCMFIYSLYADIEQFKKKTLGMAICTVLCAALNVGLNYIFIPMFGYMAAAYTTLVSYLCLAVFHGFMVKMMGMNLCYDTRFLCISSVIVILFSFFSLYLYDDNVIRYAIIILYMISSAVIFVKFRDRVMCHIPKHSG